MGNLDLRHVSVSLGACRLRNDFWGEAFDLYAGYDIDAPILIPAGGCKSFETRDFPIRQLAVQQSICRSLD